MIQILGIRGDGKSKSHTFFEKKWTAPSVVDLFANPEAYLEAIPEDHRWNLYFTVHNCAGKAPRDFTEQWVIPYDIDHVPHEQLEQVAKLASEVLHFDYNKVGILSSGHGLQIFIPIEQPIESENFFATNKPLYKLSCDLLQNALKKSHLSGEMDTSVFSIRRLMRMPNTVNRKPNKPDVTSYIIQKHIEPHGWSLLTAIDLPGGVNKGEAITKEAFKKYPPADVEAVQAECLFLKHCKQNAATLPEPQWYAQNSILGHLPGGMALAHAYSKGHPQYNEEETTAKVEQAVAASGPRTCENINNLWGGCHNCKHYKTNIISPISIKGEDYIATEGTGFYQEMLAPNGAIKIVPAFEDLVKYHKKVRGPSVTVAKNLMYTYDKNKKIWEVLPTQEFSTFVYKTMSPSPRSHVVQEALNTILANDYRPMTWFDKTVGLINLQNGVYDIENDRLLEHNMDYGFRNIATFNYDPTAKCPKWDKFLDDITQKDKALEYILQEFVGYAISGSDCWLEKCLVLLGGGRNGKSTFNFALKALVGENNYSTVGLRYFSDPNTMVQLDGKIINLADENDPHALLNSDVFKTAVSGEEIRVKRLYSDVYAIRNRAKFIFNCNEFPVSRDGTEGLLRRIQIVPFNATFDVEQGNVDMHLKNKLVTELPGILNWAIAGYRRLKSQGHLTSSVAADELYETFREAQDTVEAFFTEKVRVTNNPIHKIDNKELYDRYLDWCDMERNKYPKSKIAFGMRMKEILLKKGAVKTKSNTLRGYEGVMVEAESSVF